MSASNNLAVPRFPRWPEADVYTEADVNLPVMPTEESPNAVMREECPPNATAPLNYGCDFCALKDLRASPATYTPATLGYPIGFNPKPVPQDDGVIDVSVFLNRGKVSCKCGSNFRKRMKEMEEDHDPCIAFWQAEWRTCVLSGRGCESDWEELLDTCEPECLELTDRKVGSNLSEARDTEHTFASESRDTEDEVAGIDWASYDTDVEDKSDVEEAKDGPKVQEVPSLGSDDSDKTRTNAPGVEVIDLEDWERRRRSALGSCEREEHLDHSFSPTAYTESWYSASNEQEDPSLEHFPEGNAAGPEITNSDRLEADNSRSFDRTAYTESWYGSEEKHEEPPSEQSQPSSLISDSEREGHDSDPVETYIVTEPGQACPYCNEPDTYDEMIGCDGCGAWIHLSCAQVTRVPKGKWSCRGCVAQGLAQSKKRKHRDDDDDDDGNTPPPIRRNQKPKKSETSSSTQGADTGRARKQSQAPKTSNKASGTRAGPTKKIDKDWWTEEEEDATARFMQEVLDEKSGPHKTQAKWRVISDRLKSKCNIDKQPDAISNKWKRRLRAKYDIDERNHKDPNNMVTSHQTSEARKEAREKKKAEKGAAEDED